MVLALDVPAEGLATGDVGIVMHVYRTGHTYEVEFITLEGKTGAVITLEAFQLRPVGKLEITHARELVKR